MPNKFTNLSWDKKYIRKSRFTHRINFMPDLDKDNNNNKPALFLDRDGVLISDVGYISDPTKVHLCPGIKRLLATFNKLGWTIIIITNQSGISRGMFTWKEYELVTFRMLELVGSYSLINGIYANGYGPDLPLNSWRKPNPTMLLEASKDFSIDLKKSILIGDRLSDLQAGANAGLLTLIHVLSSEHSIKERDIIDSYKKLNTTSSKDYFKSKYTFNMNHNPFLFYLKTLHDFPFELFVNQIDSI